MGEDDVACRPPVAEFVSDELDEGGKPRLAADMHDLGSSDTSRPASAESKLQWPANIVRSGGSL
ncbi:hypothetical protein Rhsp01_42620 [Rhizobium sp. NBRC 114257]|uniref:Uncharacterized protein n=1 Tax=Rhizobium dioscoreae TaxID=2653122 RepID=A0ABQ0Z9L9_9HYPH|nr:hypothetical protein RsS93_48090 [Rhizobium dioscoreae]GLU83086.1 hypothetical protein Rhsp01_42620 [Rhizobium sp. NBRC 114257]